MPAEYLVMMNGEHSAAGIRELGDDPAPPNWMPYFGVEDAEVSLAKAKELGGAVLTGPVSAGPRDIGVVRDPQGAVFGIYAGTFDD
jgi:predicted enzyme related to lactoylglutathione lyase